MKELKILELFGGIGACSKALERLGVNYTIVDYVEIDKYAVKSFNAMHDTNFEPQDICTWDKDLDVDLIMHGSPCQDFSTAGKQAGGDKNSGTRSSLMYETIRIVEKLKPKYVVWENVKNLLGKNHIHNFNTYLETMEQLGYVSYYQVLNAKDYGIPQNRERVFTVSILKESIVYDDYNSNIRKDQDTIGTLTTNCGSSTIRNGWKIIEYTQNFEFPAKQELKIKLKDILEDKVDEKYYLTDSMIKNYQRDFGSKGKELNLDNVAPTLVASMGTGGGNTPYFKERQLLNNENINHDLSIRKLTPKECWRLMGFSDSDFEKAEKVNSNAQLYKQAGNSIVVNVLEAILKNLLSSCENDTNRR